MSLFPKIQDTVKIEFTNEEYKEMLKALGLEAVIDSEISLQRSTVITKRLILKVFTSPLLSNIKDIKIRIEK